MLYEIYGAGFVNKGAHLMLLTVMDRLFQMDPKATFTMDPNGAAPFRERARLGIMQTFPPAPNRKYLPFSVELSYALGKIAPSRLRQAYGLVTRGEIDAIIDIAGYSYGDKWPVSFTTYMAQKTKAHARRGKPVILLPQMLGPFKSPGQADAFRQIAQHATLIYAREPISYEYACETASNTSNIKKAPDITIFSSMGGQSHTPVEERREVLLIPNDKMMTHSGDHWPKIYQQRVLQMAKRAIEQGLSVKVLVHETGSGDYDLAVRLTAELGQNPSDIEIFDDPRELKQRIGRTRFIIASRFHSIVAALSTGVPAITLGWAHKYKMLLQDFQVPALLVNADDSSESVIDRVDTLCNDISWAELHETLVASKQSLKTQNDDMWSEVAQALKLTSSSN